MKIDPVIFTIPGVGLEIRWYSILAILGIISAILLAVWQVKRKGEKSEIITDSAVYIIISGVIGARVWYVVADIIGGNSYFLQHPLKILFVWEGGLNILGGIIFAAVFTYLYVKSDFNKYFLIFDAFAPGYLIGQAIGRIGNFINQELYGPPTELPWGIKIEEAHRIGPWDDMNLFPYETTKFHPSFAYEMIWNLFFAACLIIFIILYGKKIKTGIVTGIALIIVGIGRTLMEIFFRPDQPRFFGAPISTSMIISACFLLLGVFLILARHNVIHIPIFEKEENAEKIPAYFKKKKKKKKKKK